jgi:CRP/FNR family cyclic AMP-dependent transcriptional regulator
MSNAILEKVEIFEGLSQQELEALSNSSMTRSYPKNTVIINENDHADSLYVIESGRVKIYCSDKNGKEFIMNTLSEGDYFGELALLDDEKRSASVRTMEKSNFCIIYKEDFNKILEEQPNIAKTLIRNLTRRVRKLTLDVKALALQDVYGRVTNVLNSLVEEREDGVNIIPDKLTQQDIADRVGASREMVARILKDLTIGEYISFEGRHIIINTTLPENY